MEIHVDVVYPKLKMGSRWFSGIYWALRRFWALHWYHPWQTTQKISARMTKISLVFSLSLH